MVIFISSVLLLLNLFILLYLCYFSCYYSFIFYSSLNFLFLTVLLTLLSYSHLISEFSLYIVLLNSYSLQSLLYKVFSLWCSHEGSIMLWLWCFSLYIFIICLFFGSSVEKQFLRVYFIFSLLLYFYIYLFSNPFLLLNFFILEGLELNSILQNPLVSIHPPILYIGYLLTFCIFVYSVSLLFSYTISWFSLYYLYLLSFVSWLWLSFGILLGSFWAYTELGWGGWWYWDSIENIAFLPWLVLLYVVHSLRSFLFNSTYVASTVIFSLFSFLIVMFGTFFLRSGNLDSIHNFVVEFTRGYALISLVILILSLVIIFYLYDFLVPEQSSSKLGLQDIYLVTLYIYTFIIYCSTFYPFFYKLFSISGVSLSTNFYNFASLVFFIFNSFVYLYFLFLKPARSFSALFHLFFVTAVLVVILQSLINQDLVYFVEKFNLYALFDSYSFFVGDVSFYKNHYCLSIGIPIYLFYSESLLFTFFLEKNLFFNSLVFSNPSDISLSSLFDLYFILGQGDFYSGCYLQLSIKYYMLVLWLFLIFIIILSCFSVMSFVGRIRSNF